MPLTVRKFNAQVKDPQSGQMVPAGLLSSDSLQAIEAAESAAITEIQQKGAQTKADIPDDYTELSESVGALKTQLNLNPIPLTNTGKYFPTNASGQIINPENPTTNGNFDCVAVKCNPGETYTINGGGGNTANTRPWAIIDDDNKIIIKASADVVHDVITIPEGGEYLIINNRVASYPNLKSYYGVSIDAQVDYMDSQLREEVNNVINGVKCYGITEFAVAANSAHSSTADRMAVDIKAGEVFTVEVSRSDAHESGKIGTIYMGRKVAGLENETTSITFSGIKKIITAPYDIAYIGLYISALTYDQTYMVKVSPYNEVKTVETPEECAILKGNIAKNSEMNLLFFSDVHGVQNNVSRIIAYANANADVLSCIVNGGDTVYDNASGGITWYNDLIDASAVDVLTTVGNHDAWANAEHEKLPAVDLYTAYIAPVAAKVSNLVQPTGAAAAGKCYYYKDYGAVRIIVLNAMANMSNAEYWDSDEAAWLDGALDDAITNGKHVLIVNHAPFRKTSRVFDADSQWTSWDMYDGGECLVPEAVTIVQDFIGNNGIFIGWLTGHTHKDGIIRDSGQWMFTTATAHYPDVNFHKDGFGFPTAMSSSALYPTYDCFNVIGIDTTNKIFKMTRVGWNMDSAMKKRTAYAFNYGTGDVYTDR